jgi:hypothetical protein
MTVLKSIKEKAVAFFKKVKQIIKPRPTYEEYNAGIGVSNL